MRIALLLFLSPLFALSCAAQSEPPSGVEIVHEDTVEVCGQVRFTDGEVSFVLDTWPSAEQGRWMREHGYTEESGGYEDSLSTDVVRKAWRNADVDWWDEVHVTCIQWARPDQ